LYPVRSFQRLRQTFAAAALPFDTTVGLVKVTNLFVIAVALYNHFQIETKPTPQHSLPWISCRRLKFSQLLSRFIHALIESSLAVAARGIALRYQLKYRTRFLVETRRPSVCVPSYVFQIAYDSGKKKKAIRRPSQPSLIPKSRSSVHKDRKD
jgi:hypothetical protein